MKTESYKGFIIENNTTRHGGKQYSIYDSNGKWIRNCDTKKECKERIDNQTL
jgi:hypothetical protein